MMFKGGKNLVIGCRVLFTSNLNFSTSFAINNLWRLKQGLEPNPNRYGSLTNLPDYSFVDGRPVPLSLRKKQKLDLQKEYCRKIVELTHEIDVGLENYNKRQIEIKQERENILKRKLKPKGAALVNKK